MLLILSIILGVLLGMLVGGALTVRYIRSEFSADVGPRLRRIENQLDLIQTEVNLALATRMAELRGERPGSILGIRDRGTDFPVSQGPPGPDFEDEDEDDN